MVIGGEERKAHYLGIDLPQWDDCFGMGFPAATTEAFLEGHPKAFAYCGGVPRRIRYDNTKRAVAQILGDGTRKKTPAFSEWPSHCRLQERFGRPGQGKVAGLLGYARRNFMVPVPRCVRWEELNTGLLEQCRKRRPQRLRGKQQRIGERFEKDRVALLPLPAVPYEACDKGTARVRALSLVRYRSNAYSMPVCWGHREVRVQG